MIIFHFNLAGTTGYPSNSFHRTHGKCDEIDLLLLDCMWLYVGHAKNQVDVHEAGQVKSDFNVDSYTV